MSFPTPTFNQKKDSISRGYLPELYTVDDGTYASNSVYGVNAPLTNSYMTQGYQLPKGTTAIELVPGPPSITYLTSMEGCTIRQNGTEVDFVMVVYLDARKAAPVFGNEELRFRPQQYPRNKPPNQYVPLPLSMRNKPSPTFEDVEITDKMGVQIAPDATAGVGTWVLGARLLRDGTLVLIKSDLSLTGNQETALRSSDIDSTFGTPNDVIKITVRGNYLAQL